MTNSGVSPSEHTLPAAAAGTWNLGDLPVHRIGFGAMRLPASAALSAAAPPRSREAAVAVLRRAVELGVNHIDTAAFYFSSSRSANELINSALRPYPADLVIATKVGPRRDRAGSWEAPATPEELRGDVEENLRQLGRDHLDVVYLRRMGQESIAEHFGALAELRTAGLVRHLAVSDVSIAQLTEAEAIAPVVAVQNRYGIGRRDSDEVLRHCAARGIAFVPFFAIAGARASRAADEAAAEAVEDAAVREVAERHGASAAQVRLAWTLHQGPNVLAIPGTGDVAHLEQNVAAGALRLSAEDLAVLDGVAAEQRTANA